MATKKLLKAEELISKLAEKERTAEKEKTEQESNELDQESNEPEKESHDEIEEVDYETFTSAPPELDEQEVEESESIPEDEPKIKKGKKERKGSKRKESETADDPDKSSSKQGGYICCTIISISSLDWGMSWGGP